MAEEITEIKKLGSAMAFFAGISLVLAVISGMVANVLTVASVLLALLSAGFCTASLAVLKKLVLTLIGEKNSGRSY